MWRCLGSVARPFPEVARIIQGSTEYVYPGLELELSRPDLREGPAAFVFNILHGTKNPSTDLDCSPPCPSQETGSGDSRIIATPDPR